MTRALTLTAAALAYAFAATALAVLLGGAAGSVLLALSCALLGGAAAPVAGRFGFPLAMLAVDLLGLFARAPWHDPVSLLARYALCLAVPRLTIPSRAVMRAVIGGAALVGAVFAGELAHVLVRAPGDPPRRVDVAVVLGFGLLRGGAVSPVFRARIARGVELHRAGLARRLLFTGGVGAYRPAESLAALAVARALGVPEAALLYEDRSHTTRENLTEAARVMRETLVPQGPVAIVSDAFHLARARRLARDAGLDPVMVAALTPAWTDRRRATWWVLREAALLTLDDLRRVATLSFLR